MCVYQLGFAAIDGVEFYAIDDSIPKNNCMNILIKHQHFLEYMFGIYSTGVWEHLM